MIDRFPARYIVRNFEILQVSDQFMSLNNSVFQPVVTFKEFVFPVSRI